MKPSNLSLLKKYQIAKNITEIKNLRKIKGSPNAYRVRVGDYRIGIFVEDELISFSRVLHRKEVYRYFP